MCERSVSCASLGGSSLARIGKLLDRLRAAPVSGMAPGGGTSLTEATANAGELYLVMSYAGHWPTAYRDLDAAARDYLQTGDSLPLLRLVAETRWFYRVWPRPLTSNHSARDFFVAVTCSDFPILWNARAGFGHRDTEYWVRRWRSGGNRPKAVRPLRHQRSFRATQYTDHAVDVPRMAPTGTGLSTRGALSLRMRSSHPIPTLVLSGDLDTLTSPSRRRIDCGPFCPMRVNYYFPI